MVASRTRRDLPDQLLNMAMNSPSPSSKNYQATKIHDTQTKSRVKSGSKSAAHSVNYAEQSHGKKKSNQTKKQLTKATSKTLVHPASDVDVNAVPNPAPDTGGSHTLYPSGAIYTGVLPVIMPTSTQQPLSTSGFSPLPPLSAFATSLAVTTVATSSASKSAAASSATVLGSQQQAHPSAPKHLSTVIIVLLGVGSAFLLLGCYVLYRMFKRPRKHHYPTPSLPILQDDYMEERKIDAEEESLFGGKERISAKPGSDGTPLTWTQYPHVSLAKPPPSFNVDDGPPNRKSSDFGQKPTYPFSGPNASATNTAARTMNRISAVSASVYPGSPMSGNPTARRMSTSRDIRQSVIVSNKLHVPSTYGTSDLYGGPASPLPPNPTTPKATAMSSAKPGRARVKAPYAPASLLRSSANAPHTHDRNPFEESQYVLPPLSPMVKSEDHRERDTKALASALGLASPTPASPQTIYPDDSITLAGDRRRSRSQFIMSPTLDASARLGKLMLGDTQSMVSIADAGSAPQANSSSRARAVARKRVEEKPPRVPSPPPLPSLAQMALAHSNPQDFEDYRSPTYSIYGLYEADRKSRNPDGGGY